MSWLKVHKRETENKANEQKKTKVSLLMENVNVTKKLLSMTGINIFLLMQFYYDIREKVHRFPTVLQEAIHHKKLPW